MHSRKLLWLINKEWRELVVSKAWWTLLILMGPLVGMSFISSVHTYSEISAGVGEALSPLIGVWAPTFSACELAAVFLLPFVAIRLVGGDRESGALKLELQQDVSTSLQIAAKALVLLGGWVVAMLPPLSAVFLWKSYGGSVYPPELMTLAVGHVLNAGLTIGLAAAMASMTDHHSTAAILTLSVTVGTWVLSLLGWDQYTPASMVAEFQHGLIRLDVVLVGIALTLFGLGLAAIWIRLGIHVRRRVYESIALGAVVAAAILISSLATPNWDTSEARSNSFPEADERVLRELGPLYIEVHLAQEDPRRIDLENRALSKLRRVTRKVHIRYVAATSTGLFEQANAGYGEIWYQFDGRKTMSRATTAEAVLESIYAVAGMKPPVEDNENIFRGHPLVVTARGAAIVFYGLWPALFLGCAILTRRNLK